MEILYRNKEYDNVEFKKIIHLSRKLNDLSLMITRVRDLIDLTS